MQSTREHVLCAVLSPSVSVPEHGSLQMDDWLTQLVESCGEPASLWAHFR